MEESKTVLLRFAEIQGWNESSQVDILCDFINEQMNVTKLRDYLQAVADCENEEYCGEGDEEPECEMCGDTYVVVNGAGHRRPCDYCDHDQWELPEV